MSRAVIVRGHAIDGTTVRLDEPLPPDAKEIEVVVRLRDEPARCGERLGDFLRNLPPGTRTKEDIDRQIAEERDSWD
jgi:hypothetical protein